jgi:predicted nucleotidyltransferase
LVVIQISKFKEYIIKQVQSLKFIAVVSFIIILSFVVQYSVFSDEHKSLVEKFIKDSPVVNDNVGVIKSVKLTNITSVGLKISDDKAYKKYFYTVKGEKYRVRLTVILTQKNNEYAMQINNIKKSEIWW